MVLTSAASFKRPPARRILLTVENTLYCVGPWLVPHLLLAGLSLLLAVLAGFVFQRFRNAFKG